MLQWVRPYLVVGGVLVLGVGYTDPATPASTISACVHRVNHHVRIVSDPAECRGFESLASWQIAGPQGIPGPAGPQGPQGEQGPPGPAGSGGPSVVDANGQKVGDTIHLAGHGATVLLTLDGRMFPLDVTPQGFKVSKDSSGGNLIFVGNTNCTGQAYYHSDRYFSPMKLAVVGPPGAMLYIRDDTVSESPYAVQGSQWRQSGDTWVCSQFYGWGPGSLFPVKLWFDLNTVFAPPFSVQ